MTDTTNRHQAWLDEACRRLVEQGPQYGSRVTRSEWFPEYVDEQGMSCLLGLMLAPDIREDLGGVFRLRMSVADTIASVAGVDDAWLLTVERAHDSAWMEWAAAGTLSDADFFGSLAGRLQHLCANVGTWMGLHVPTVLVEASRDHG